MIFWTQPTQSGLGDRLIDILHLLAYARVKSHGLSFAWPKFIAKPIDIAHRSTDILLANVLEHVTFPDGITFCPDDETFDGEIFDHAVGGDADPEGFHEKYLKGVCPLDVYQWKLRTAADDFGFCGEINAFLGKLPPTFSAFHIRRGDKVRDEPSDGNFIRRSELVHLNTLTYAALDAHLPYFDMFFFCGDEDTKIGEFSEYVRCRGKSVLKLPKMEKWRSTYFDMAAMSRAKVVVTSNRYSAFSRFSAILGNIPWATVYMLASSPKA